MPRKTRRKHRVCSSCNTRFTGHYCPYCGAEYGKKRILRAKGGFVSGVLRFLLSLAALCLLFAIAFAALDYFASAPGGAHSTAQAVFTSIQNALPQNVLDLYTSVKAAYLEPFVVWTQNLHNSFNITP